MKIATLANARTSKPGAAKRNSTSTKPRAKARNKSTVKAATKTQANKSTALARRPALSPAAIAKIENGARAAQLASLKASGRLTQANKRGKKKRGKARHKRNGSGGSTASRFLSLRNPNLRNLTGTLVAGAMALAGGGVATVIAAAVLAILDRFAPNIARHRYAQPFATFVAAIVAVPMIASIRLFRLGEASRNAAMAGGVTFALGGAFNTATGKNVFDDAGGIGGEVRSGINRILPGETAAAEDTSANAGGMAGLGAVARAERLIKNRRPLNFSPAARAAGGGGASRWR
jgi:hypothetical protein